MAKQDYYEVLGLSKGAGDDEIKKAYRKLAKQYHPDMNPGDAAAETKFKEVNEAYDVLSDPDKKAKYDQYGHAAFDPASGFGGAGGGFGFDGFDISDIFSSFFGGGTSSRRQNGPMRGDDIRLRLTLTFEEAVFGCKKEVSYQRVQRCADCGGSGAAKGTSAKTCPDCQGRGQVKVQQRTPFGMMQSSRTCDKCGGTGKIIETPCKSCRGGFVKATKKLDVSIPAGIDDGQGIALRGVGCDGRNGGPAGDLNITVNVRLHPIFERDGYDIYYEVPVTYAELVLGAKIKIPTIDGEDTLEIPDGTQTGTTFTFRNKGVQVVNSTRRGNMYVTVVLETPKGLDKKQKEALRAFDEKLKDGDHPKREKFFKKYMKK